MTNSTLFLNAHAQARIEHRRFGGSYRECFTNALNGFYAVRRGFAGSMTIGGTHD